MVHSAIPSSAAARGAELQAPADAQGRLESIESSLRRAGALGAVPSSSFFGSLSPAELLFMLQMERKQAIDGALETAMAQMKERIDQQKQLNTYLANLGSLTLAEGGHLVVPKEMQEAFVRAGFLTGSDGELAIGGNASQITKDKPEFLGRVTRDGVEQVVIPKEKIEAFKESLGKFISALSGSNELQSMSLQRLLNSANEATQMASTLMKQTHDTAMSIIRNMA